MQTFLISYHLEENAKAIDSKRLFKQLIEGYSLLDGILNNKKSWANHPALTAWKDNPVSLFRYIKRIWWECQNRGIAKDSLLFQKCQDLIIDYAIHNEDNYKKEVAPKWWGRLDIINSHKNRLYCKGEIDIVCIAIKKALKLKSIDRWLKLTYNKSKNQLKWADCLELKKWCIHTNIFIDGKNHYAQFGWQKEVDFNPAGEYIWPIKKKKF